MIYEKEEMSQSFSYDYQIKPMPITTQSFLFDYRTA